MQIKEAKPLSVKYTIKMDFFERMIIKKFRSSHPDVFCKNGLRPTTLLKKRLWHRCFPVNFVKFLRTPFYIKHLWWLLLKDKITITIRLLSKLQMFNLSWTQSPWDTPRIHACNMSLSTF